VLIVAGFQAGRPWAAAVAPPCCRSGSSAWRTPDQTVIGKPRRRERDTAPGLRAVVVLTVIAATAMLALTVAALWLPDSAIVDGLLRGLT
jgi:hypothetical protein